MGSAQPTVNGEVKPLGHAQGVLGACSTQGCSQPPAGRLGDSSVVLTCSAHPMGAPSTHQNTAGAITESLCSFFQLSPSAGEAFPQV